MTRKHLTERQKEVLKLACFPNKEIARRLCIEKCTVATHFNDIRARLIPATNKASMLVEGIRREEINIEDIEIK